MAHRLCARRGAAEKENKHFAEAWRRFVIFTAVYLPLVRRAGEFHPGSAWGGRCTCPVAMGAEYIPSAPGSRRADDSRDHHWIERNVGLESWINVERSGAKASRLLCLGGRTGGALGHRAPVECEILTLTLWALHRKIEAVGRWCPQLGGAVPPLVFLCRGMRGSIPGRASE